MRVRAAVGGIGLVGPGSVVVQVIFSLGRGLDLARRDSITTDMKCLDVRQWSVWKLRGVDHRAR